MDDHLLHIRHRTEYRYAFPVRFGTHRLVMRPREGHDLRVESHQLSVSPEASVTWTRDIFGNSVAWARMEGESTTLEVISEVVVRRFFDPSSPPTFDHSPSAYPPEYDGIEQGVAAAYLAPVFPEETQALQGWLTSLPKPTDFPSIEAFVVRLTECIKDAVKYQRRESKGVQSPGSTLALGSGSCRDSATLMMETLRHLGIAARFASGYLDCPATRAARGSTHAWTEVYFPHLGWRGFDPTTGRVCDHRHIVTGTSHHPRGVMPLSGRYSGPANAFLSMSVGVEFSSPETSIA
ncbi:transglutaminase-like putative cysteine protease [Haloferula luteola]|uniref:Transglutaminase-like putative cysteine protease n=1 Tax=Haloferula luteola TaxID=595692 RepID=A0A840V5Q2_9BACT|nr:transglutaminase family protein [Haloferula luteola]MBB5352963.1 transglutaminase-like putative cysteine protease [Haloferula luteola]